MLAPTPDFPPDHTLADWRGVAQRLEAEVAKAVIGQAEVIRLVTIALFARGHVLLEGDVGVGKTTLLRAFARAMGGDYERVEGTIDLMPADLVYHTDVDSQGRPRIEPGPLVRHGDRLVTFFFNEINRARPQVQSLLLRAMAERSVTAFNREVRFPAMTVFADRNKVEKEETFELASAARDRFLFELSMPRPADVATRRALVFDTRFHDAEALVESVAAGIVDWARLGDAAAAIQQTVHASETIERYALDLWSASEDPVRFGVKLDDVDMKRLVVSGASPRGMSALLRAARVVAWMDSRTHLEPDDLRRVMSAALGHRIFLAPVYELRRTELAPKLVQSIMDRVAAP